MSELMRKINGLTVMEREVCIAIYTSTGKIPTKMIQLYRRNRRYNARPNIKKIA
jgi:hypothetical protein